MCSLRKMIRFSFLLSGKIIKWTWNFTLSKLKITIRNKIKSYVSELANDYSWEICIYAYKNPFYKIKKKNFLWVVLQLTFDTVTMKCIHDIMKILLVSDDIISCYCFAYPVKVKMAEHYNLNILMWILEFCMHYLCFFFTMKLWH